MQIEAITSAKREIRDPALPEELPNWTKFDTKSDGTVEVRMKLPFSCFLEEPQDKGKPVTKVYRDAEIVFMIPVGKFAIFTAECVTSTTERLGKVEAKRIFDNLGDLYYRKLILTEMLQKTGKD